MKMKLLSVLLLLFVCGNVSVAQKNSDTIPIKVIRLTNGMNIHYLTAGYGQPLIFVHGSISDYTYWNDEMNFFSKYYHVISYSRRYNYPNHNPAINGYSALVDAEDLKELIDSLHLGKVIVIGHSYGALTALFFTIKHPEMIKRLVLAEPPAVPLLDHLEAPNKKLGIQLRKDINECLVKPMQKYFRDKESEKGVEVFINYVYNNPKAWQKFSVESKVETMRDANEWNVMLTKGTLFPPIKIKDIANIKIPVLMLSGENSYKFLNFIDGELHHLIPNNYQAIFHGVGHQMWLQKSSECEQITLDFFNNRIGEKPFPGVDIKYKTAN